MNSSTDYNNPIHATSGYAMGMALGVLILIMTILIAACFCSSGVQELPAPSYPITNRGSSIASRGSVVIDIGLNEATLASYYKLLYSQAKLQHKDNDSQPFCCSICLGDYEDNDMLRLLPDCGHVFHLKCVDCWLRQHSTCPLCRKSLAPTPPPESSR